ncbi:MAG: AAA family ATPase [Deltaproteobacteria bacterium]|nr:AAA family ATPase [Deltaproteobacteria bacterium]
MSISDANRCSIAGKSRSRGNGRNIAITGKGGTGKTVLATLMIKLLAERGNLRILAVDADSAKSLPYTLGMMVAKTVGGIRQDIIENPGEKRRIADTHIGTVIKNIVETGKGFDLLVMGRPEAPGCFCTVNDLLRYGIETLSQDYDITIIDAEAGPEQVNRRVIQSIDTLLIVADTSNRSLQTASDIMKIAQGHGNVEVGRTGLIINKFKGNSGRVEEVSHQMGLEILGYIPEDENVTHYDSLGRPLLELPADSPSLVAIPQILRQIC